MPVRDENQALVNFYPHWLLRQLFGCPYTPIEIEAQLGLFLPDSDNQAYFQLLFDNANLLTPTECLLSETIPSTIFTVHRDAVLRRTWAKIQNSNAESWLHKIGRKLNNDALALCGIKVFDVDFKSHGLSLPGDGGIAKKLDVAYHAMFSVTGTANQHALSNFRSAISTGDLDHVLFWIKKMVGLVSTASDKTTQKYKTGIARDSMRWIPQEKVWVDIDIVQAPDLHRITPFLVAVLDVTGNDSFGEFDVLACLYTFAAGLYKQRRHQGPRLYKVSRHRHLFQRQHTDT